MDAHWLSDLELEEEPSFFHQQEPDCSTHLAERQIAVAFCQNQNHDLHRYSNIPSSSNNTNTTLFTCNPMNIPEMQKTTAQTISWDSGIIAQNSSSQSILTFGAEDVATEEHALSYGGIVRDMNQPKEDVKLSLPGIVGKASNYMSQCDATLTGSTTICRGNDTMSVYSQSQREIRLDEHILAERKRREKLRQRFIALTKIVPDLKKMDKASVLEDAIKYLKQLQDKVQDLEARATKQIVKSAAIVKKSHLLCDDYDEANGNSPCSEIVVNDGSVLKRFQKVEVMNMSEKTVIIRINCENKKGALVKVLTEIEGLGLSITSTSAMPFAGLFLDITAVAQIEDSTSVKDVVRKLNQLSSNPRG